MNRPRENSEISFESKEMLSRFSRHRRDLIPVLQRFQAQYGHVSAESVSRIADYLRLTESEVFGVLTFYKMFSRVPRGKYLITVCLGTACHVRGGSQIADEFARKLRIRPGETTADRLYTLETVNCLGCCAIGPVVIVNGRYYSQVSLNKINDILGSLPAAA